MLPEVLFFLGSQKKVCLLRCQVSAKLGRAGGPLSENSTKSQNTHEKAPEACLTWVSLLLRLLLQTIDLSATLQELKDYTTNIPCQPLPFQVLGGLSEIRGASCYHHQQRHARSLVCSSPHLD